MSLCQDFSKSLVNSKNKYSSCDLIRDFTVATASKADTFRIVNGEKKKRTPHRLINKKAIRSSGEIHFLKDC